MACVAETNGGRLMRLGYSPAQRKQLYYGVCVPIRIALAVAIFITAWKAPKPTAWTAATLGTAIALYNAYLATQRGCRWWHPASMSIVAAAAAIVGAVYLTTGNRYVTLHLIGGLALAHVAAGVALSLQENPWS